MEKDIDIVSSDEIVETITLDDYVEVKSLKPDLIKIDVEEAESLVLEGMTGILDRDKPGIIIEVSSKTISPVVKKLKGFGYRFYNIDDVNMKLIPTDDPKVRVTCNILAECADSS